MSRERGRSGDRDRSRGRDAGREGGRDGSRDGGRRDNTQRQSVLVRNLPLDTRQAELPPRIIGRTVPWPATARPAGNRSSPT